MKKSNVFKELLARDDYVDKMLEEYINTECDYNCLIETKNIYKSNYSKKFFLEAYFGINYDNLPSSKMQKFVQEYNLKFEDMPVEIKSEDMSSIYYQGILEKKGYIPKEAIPKNVKIYNAIKNMSNELSFTKTSDTLVYIGLYAKFYEGYQIINGTRVNCYLFHSNDYVSIETKKGVDEYFLKDHPTYTLLRNATRKYNCHSYAWYTRSSLNSLWIYYPYPIYSNTKYYTKWHVPMSNPGEGARVLFFSDDTLLHSAIKVNTTECESKMGTRGVYKTTVNEVMAQYGANRIEVYLPN